MLSWVMNLNFRGTSFFATIPVKDFISKEGDQTHTSLEGDMGLISLEADQTKDNPRC